MGSKSKTKGRAQKHLLQPFVLEIMWYQNLVIWKLEEYKDTQDCPKVVLLQM